MTSIAPSRVAIAEFRAPGEQVPVRFRGVSRAKHLSGVIQSRLALCDSALRSFEQDWPLAASSVEFVVVVPQLKDGRPGDLASTKTQVLLGEVCSQVRVVRGLLTDPEMDDVLAGAVLRCELVAKNIAGILWHEFAHVLLNTLILRAEPRTRSCERMASMVVMRALGSAVPAAQRLAARKLSHRASLSAEEFVAEAITDVRVRGDKAHTFSRDIYFTLSQLWMT